MLVFGHHPIWDAETEERTDRTFGLLPEATEALAATFVRRELLVGYFAGHTHRNHVVRVPARPEVPFCRGGVCEGLPRLWAEYRVFDGGVLQIHRRISTPDALAWSERTRACTTAPTPAMHVAA